MAKKKSQAKKKTPVPALQTEEAVSREVETTEAQTEVKAGEETALVKATETEKETKKAEKTKEDRPPGGGQAAPPEALLAKKIKT